MFMSDVACVGWIDAITSSRAKRRMSSSAITCACSIRGRSAWRCSFVSMRLERVEHEAIARVADRVHVQLPALRSRQRRQLLHLLARVHHQAAVVRLIAVVLHQRRAATAERAVGPRFHGAHLQAIVVLGQARTRLHERGGLRDCRCSIA